MFKWLSSLFEEKVICPACGKRMSKSDYSYYIRGYTMDWWALSDYGYMCACYHIVFDTPYEEFFNNLVLTQDEFWLYSDDIDPDMKHIKVGTVQVFPLKMISKKEMTKYMTCSQVDECGKVIRVISIDEGPLTGSEGVKWDRKLLVPKSLEEWDSKTESDLLC